MEERLVKGSLTRRDLLKLGMTGAVFAWLNHGCQKGPGSSSPGPTDLPTEPEPVYELTDGKTLYDDFDGHGNFQTYNNQNLAEAGKISSRIWNVWSGWGTADVVENPGAGSLLTVVNEDGQRVEYRSQEKKGQEIKYVFDADGKLIDAVPHIPGQPYHGSQKLLCLGAKDAYYETPNGPVSVQKGKIYGGAEIMRAGGSGYALGMAGSLLSGDVSCEISNPAELEFADNKSFSADVMLSSSSAARRLSAILDYHTTIPDQPPGKSWFAQIGIGTMLSDDLYIIGQYGNVNTGYRFLQYLANAQPDTWYNLRMDMVTHKEDSSLKVNELRIDYYVNGVLQISSIPEDSEIILDPQKTGAGPSRILTVGTAENNKSAVAYFDNVRAVYKNRVS